MRGPNLVQTGSAVLTFIGYKQTERQRSKLFIYISILPKDVSVRTDGRRIRIGVSRTVKNVKS